MSKKENIKYANLPIVNKSKIAKEEIKNEKNLKLITTILIFIIVILVLFCGYSMAKAVDQILINGKGEIAEPILIIENNPSIDITALNNYGTYTFKIKNFNQQNKVTETDLKYYIEILSNVDESIIIELYQEKDKINLINNKTDYIHISKEEKQEIEYKIIIRYDKEKSNNIYDIMEKIQVKVHTEQVKA
ncbi:MAG: hypothetical protein HFJ60_00485 [Clostridia bacterium]|jgi:hypothetical protein|nr:hypothetical protein [Clostridia bacterium]